jgi:hypothetical protein
MINLRDLYTSSQLVPMLPEGETQSIGTLIIEYEVHRCTDVRNLILTRGYLVEVRQRVVIPNNGVSLMGQGTLLSYTYPIMFTASIKLLPGASLSASPFYLVAATPKTIDSSVSMNVTASAGTTAGTNAQRTQGSSTSETSTWNTNPLISALSGNTDSKSTTNFTENMTGTSQGKSATSGASDSMSVKEWAAYLAVDSADQVPTWVFAQTFPWDPIQYHYTDGTTVVLPQDIQNLLFNPNPITVYPPSRIALFGLNFGMSARWLVLSDNSAPIDQLSFEHVVAPFTGSHSVASATSSTLLVSLTTGSVFAYRLTPASLDLALLALDPIPPGSAGNSATIGFVLSQFVTKPSNANGFSIASTGNTLIVRGTGFTDPVSNDTPMTANVTGTATASMTVYFKVIDEDEDYTLFFKHWVTTPTGATMTITVNGTPITRHIDSLEAGSGTDNVTRVLLRRKSYSSDEYFDYVVMGLNTITIEVASDVPAGAPPPACTYAMRALAVT